MELIRLFGLPESYAHPAIIAEAVTILAAAYPRQPLSENTVMLYVHALADVTEAHLLEAIRYWVKTKRYFPSVGEIRMQIAEFALNLPAPDEALRMVSDAIQGDMKIHNKLVLEAARSAGVDAHIQSDSSPGIWRAQFIKTYSAMRKRHIERFAEGPMGGEQENGGKE